MPLIKRALSRGPRRQPIVFDFDRNEYAPWNSKQQRMEFKNMLSLGGLGSLLHEARRPLHSAGDQNNSWRHALGRHEPGCYWPPGILLGPPSRDSYGGMLRPDMPDPIHRDS